MILWARPQNALRGLGQSLCVINIQSPRGLLDNQRVIAQEQRPSGKKGRPSRSEETFQSILRKLD